VLQSLLFDGLSHEKKRHETPHCLSYYFGIPVIVVSPAAGVLNWTPLPSWHAIYFNLPAQRAYAWSTDGCASVLASIASAQIALGLGISAIMIFAISAYFLAFITLKLSVSNFKRE
jgi:hypothetical protein